jgi:hypothetical protein
MRAYEVVNGAELPKHCLFSLLDAMLSQQCLAEANVAAAATRSPAQSILFICKRTQVNLFK